MKEQNNNLTSTAPERIWLYPEKQGGIPFMEHDEFPKHDEDAYEYGNTYWSEDRNHRAAVPYLRADLAGQEAPQWKPIAEIPEELKDGREVLLMAGIDYSEGHIDDVPGMVVARWDKWYGEEVGWAIVNDFTYTIFAVNPTHYFDFGTVALPTAATAPQAEAEEGE